MVYIVIAVGMAALVQYYANPAWGWNVPVWYSVLAAIGGIAIELGDMIRSR